MMKPDPITGLVRSWPHERGGKLAGRVSFETRFRLRLRLRSRSPLAMSGALPRRHRSLFQKSGPAVTDQLCGGRMTLSITWMTPFEAATSGFTTAASLIITLPCSVETFTIAPLTVLA